MPPPAAALNASPPETGVALACVNLTTRVAMSMSSSDQGLDPRESCPCRSAKRRYRRECRAAPEHELTWPAKPPQRRPAVAERHPRHAPLHGSAAGPAGSRQPYVGKKHPYARVLLMKVKAGTATVSCEDVITEFAQKSHSCSCERPRRPRPQEWFRSARHVRPSLTSTSFSACRELTVWNARKIELDCRTLADFAVNLDVAALIA